MTANNKMRAARPRCLPRRGQPVSVPATDCVSLSSPFLRKMDHGRRTSHSTIEYERNTAQVIENTQSRYALSVNFFSTERASFFDNLARPNRAKLAVASDSHRSRYLPSPPPARERHSPEWRFSHRQSGDWRSQGRDTSRYGGLL